MMHAASRATRAWRRASPSRSEYFWPLRPPLLPLPTVAVESLHVTVLATAGVGDGRRATEVPIGAADDLTADDSGNVYLVDWLHGRVRKVGTDGVMTTVLNAYDIGRDLNGIKGPDAAAVDDRSGRIYVADTSTGRIWVIENAVPRVFAGTGVQDYSGDGGPATAATLSGPADVAVGPDGTVYVADTGNHRVRAISPHGIIRTVAGRRSIGGSIDWSEASLLYPLRVALAPDGSIYVVDRGGARITRTVPGESRETIPSWGRSYPVESIAVSASGDLFANAGGTLWRRSAAKWEQLPVNDRRQELFGAIAFGAGRLLAVETRTAVLVTIGAGGQLRTVAGNGTVASFGDGGPADGASFACQELAVGRDGSVLFSDPVSDRIAVIRPDGTIHTLAGGGRPGFAGDGGPATAALLSQPAGIALDRGGAVYVADSGNNRIRRIDVSGTITTVAGAGLASFSGDGGPATKAALDFPLDVVVGRAGELYIADSGNRSVRRVDLATGVISTVASLDMFPGHLVGGRKDELIVTGRGASAVVRVDLESGKVEPLSVRTATSPPSTGHVRRVAMARDARGRLLIAEGDRLLVGFGEDADRKNEKKDREHEREEPSAADEAFRAFTLSDGRHPLRGLRSAAADRNGDLFLCDVDARRILRLAGSELSGDASE